MRERLAVSPVMFSVPGPQVATNAAYRAGRGRYWMTDDGVEFKERIRFFARQAMRGRIPYTGEVSVVLDLHYKTRRNDIDGPIKLILDALQGIAYPNDRQVSALTVYKRHDPTHPRTMIQVAPLEGAP
jgi:Holliday junction resolvase RusA-like endonuclease